MKKNIFKSVFAVAAIAAVGLGSYKAYGSYTIANMSEEDLLMAENIEALAFGSDGKTTTRNCQLTKYKVYKRMYKDDPSGEKVWSESLHKYVPAKVPYVDEQYVQSCDDLEWKKSQAYPDCEYEPYSSYYAAKSDGYTTNTCGYE